MVNATVHSYENEFPADVLPRGYHRGTWTGYYVITEEGRHVPTDVAVIGQVRVILTVTDETVSVALDLKSATCQRRAPRNPAAEGERAAAAEGVTFVEAVRS